MAVAWTPKAEHVITEVYLNADNSECALVINEGESDILLFRASRGRAAGQHRDREG